MIRDPETASGATLMVTLVFLRSNGSEVWAAAEGQIRLHGGRLSIEDGDEAAFAADAWQYGGETFPVVRIASAVYLSVERDAEIRDLGRFEQLRLVGGTVTDAETGNAILEFDPASEMWQNVADGSTWASVTLAEG